ncbi:hypothetical protein NNC19_07505 [Clostridium sp. SHJSY1]|uniref:hypothetical protein n=1 Tax=Clostridium sp. SHJSY1 TaxID=2942483 RepID=UPI00287696F3|nr:hypothetical protein [Clostridium sp. SHJSY1]MDS0525521.1 hypothetical protein [Clostridium sp. SHJSY1]
MYKLFKMSWLNIRNSLKSKVFFLGILAAFIYSSLWALFVHPKMYGLLEYDFEMGRFLFLIMLYVAVSILRDDIRFNTNKAVFTGIFSRVEVMISKVMSLIIWGGIFFAIVEIDNVIIACILYKKIGINGFLALNHLELFIIYLVIMLVMGSFMMLAVSIVFKENKAILFLIVFLGMINFYTAGIVTLVNRKPEIAASLTGYMITPFYNIGVLAQGYFNMESIIINLAWAILFIISSTIIIYRREIR